MVHKVPENFSISDFDVFHSALLCIAYSLSKSVTNIISIASCDANNEVCDPLLFWDRVPLQKKCSKPSLNYCNIVLISRIFLFCIH